VRTVDIFRVEGKSNLEDGRGDWINLWIGLRNPTTKQGGILAAHIQGEKTVGKGDFLGGLKIKYQERTRVIR